MKFKELIPKMTAHLKPEIHFRKSHHFWDIYVKFRGCNRLTLKTCPKHKKTHAQQNSNVTNQNRTWLVVFVSLVAQTA